MIIIVCILIIVVLRRGNLGLGGGRQLLVFGLWLVRVELLVAGLFGIDAIIVIIFIVDVRLLNLEKAFGAVVTLVRIVGYLLITVVVVVIVVGSLLIFVISLA